MVHDEEDRRSPRRPPGADINNWRFEVAVYISGEAAPAGVVDRAGLLEAGGFDLETAAVESSTAGLVIYTKGPELDAFHLVSDEGTHRRRIFVLPDEGGVRSARPTETLAKRVTIAGSVGSKIAEAVVRSGIHRVTLVDGDVFLPPRA
jgi:hypothetical protein